MSSLLSVIRQECSGRYILDELRTANLHEDCEECSGRYILDELGTANLTNQGQIRHVPKIIYSQIWDSKNSKNDSARIRKYLR